MSGEQSDKELASEDKRGPGRTAGFRMSEAHRSKIKNSRILSVLIDHVENGTEISPSRVTAGLGLLKKVMPDLAAMTINGDDDGDPLRTVTEIRLVGG